jgi:hypothetical protein
MAKTDQITLERLKSLIHYNPDSGEFTWLKDSKNQKDYGDRAGYVSVDGYVVITIEQVQHRAHRLAWFYMTGERPESVDHANRIKSDNRFCNLRASTLQQNNCNKGLTVRNTSGVLGVSWCKKRCRWKVQVKSFGHDFYFGMFDDIELAGLVAEEARAKIHGDYAPILRNIEEVK